MAGQGFPWLLPLELLRFFRHPVDTSSRPAGDPRASALLPEAPGQRDIAPGTKPLEHVALLYWSCAAPDLLTTGVLGWWLGRTLWRRWERSFL